MTIKRIILTPTAVLLTILAIAPTLPTSTAGTVHIGTTSMQSTAIFTITLTFTGANQTAADNKRDAALVDFGKAKGIDIFQADGVTVDSAKLVVGVRGWVRTHIRDTVIDFRASAAAASARNTEAANLGNP